MQEKTYNQHISGCTQHRQPVCSAQRKIVREKWRPKSKDAIEYHLRYAQQFLAFRKFYGKTKSNVLMPKERATIILCARKSCTEMWIIALRNLHHFCTISFPCLFFWIFFFAFFQENLLVWLWFTLHDMSGDTDRKLKKKRSVWFELQVKKSKISKLIWIAEDELKVFCSFTIHRISETKIKSRPKRNINFFF